MNTIKELREKRGLSQSEVAKLLDVTKEYISMLERVKRNPSDKLKKEMAKLYKESFTDIYMGIKEIKRLKNSIK